MCQSRPSLHGGKSSGHFAVSDEPPYDTRCRKRGASITSKVRLWQILERYLAVLSRKDHERSARNLNFAETVPDPERACIGSALTLT
jgi:hypothetical protein